MRQPRPGALVVAAAILALAGCGDVGGGRPAAQSPSTTTSACQDQGVVRASVEADLDGDGRPETVDYAETPACPTGSSLRADVGGTSLTAPVGGGTPVGDGDLSAVQIPGRHGELVLVEQQHPRGGFQARLFGYADGTFEELSAAGSPVFDFVATDAMSTPTAVTCSEGGFTVTQAKAHQPIGVVPAWDVYRTAYTVDGNDVTRGATTETANVLDRQLRADPSNLVHYPFFQDCLARH